MNTGASFLTTVLVMAASHASASEAPSVRTPTPGIIRPTASLDAPPIPAGNNLISAMYRLADGLVVGLQENATDSLTRRLAVFEFDAAGVSVEKKRLNAVVTEVFTSRLASLRHLSLVERSRIEIVLQELKLQRVALGNPRIAKQAGALFGAEAVVIGAVSEAGTQYLVTARMVSVETGEIMAAVETTVERESLIALSDKAVLKKTYAGMIARSALLPGWGQIENDQRSKGYAYLGSAAAVLVATVGTGVFWGLASDEYNTKGEAYRTAKNVRDAKAGYQTWNHQYDKTENLKIVTLALAGSYGVIWLVNILDMAVNGRDIERIDLDGIGSNPNTSMSAKKCKKAPVSMIPLPPTDGGRLGMGGSLSVEW